MPEMLVTKNFVKLDIARRKGYTTASAQGSSRSSKTYSIVQWLVRQCHDTSNTTVSIVRKTMPALKRSVYRDFKEIMIDWGLWSAKNMNKSEWIYTFDNGSWIEFFSCENEQKMRGSKRKILYVNEANEISFLEWQQLQMRTTEFSIIDYNPSFTDEHWINLVNAEKKTFHWISTYKDNPFLEQKVIDEIESLQWKNQSLWQVYGLGLQAIVEGLIFKKYKIMDEFPNEAKRHRFIGMDFGYTNDPTAIVAVSIAGNKLYLDELCYRTEMLTSDIIAELKKVRWSPKIIAESAEPRLIDEIYNGGLDIHPVRKYQGSVVAGINKMLEYELIVSRRSYNLIKELKNYTYRQDKEGKWLNEPIDMYNHCFAGDTLITTARGPVPIESVEAGDYVLTSQGYRRVLRRWNNGVREIKRFTLGFDDKCVILRATPEHRVKSLETWQKLEDLAVGCLVFTQTKEKKAKISEIKRIFATNCGKVPVYDLEVEGIHEYFANGLLVHNCMDATRYVILSEVLGQNGDGLDAEDLADMLP